MVGAANKPGFQGVTTGMDVGRVAAKKRPLVAVVAAIAVAAVAGGGLLAAARGPRSQAGAADAPLAVTATAGGPQATSTGTLPTTVPLDATKLRAGRAPQLTYVRGRTVFGTTGTPVKVPGTPDIAAAARLWDTTLTVQVKSATSSELVIQDYTGKVVKQVPKVDSLVTSADDRYAAYASGGQYAVGTAGGSVYLQQPDPRTVAVLHRPKDYNLHVLAVVGKTVYFHSGPGPDAPSNLYRWDVDKKSIRQVDKVVTPVAVAADASLAAGLPVFTDSGLCSVVTELASGLQRWRTCQYRLDRFSGGSAFVVGLPPGTGEPYGERRTSVLDSKTGKLLRTWTAPSLRAAVAEDDDHLLLLWNDQPEPQSHSAVVRCTVSTGACELATPLSSEPLLLGS